MSILLIHNGNSQVKPWGANFYNCQSQTCVLDDWVDAKTISEKIELSKIKSVCTDLTGADRFEPLDLHHLKSGFRCIKVITEYQRDLKNLEPVWQNFDQQQWLRSSLSRLSLADEIVFWDPISLSSTNNGPPMVFTPGRSGTNVIADITKLPEYIHHQDDLITRPEFQKLVGASKLISVLRRSFVNQVISDLVSVNYGFMLTTRDTLHQHTEKIKQWQKVEFTHQDAVLSLEKFLNYTDLLLALKFFYNKHILFSFLEDLTHHYNQINHVKNPYKNQEIVSNYDYAVDVCDKIFQPVYDQVISKIQCVLGTNIYNI